MNPIVEPKILKGFRDSLPETETVKKQIIRKLEDVFTRFGFDPIDTPVLEYTSVLLGKGSGETDKQIYRFQDNGGRDVAMRFDLTVPFARFTATHRQELPMPFRRFHIAKVWRGENTQKGRYREFVQCDFDIVGSDSLLNDLEILLLMNESFRTMGIEKVTFELSHRGIFNTFLKKEGIENLSVEILRTVDKLGKIGKDEVKNLLTQLTNQEKAEKILHYIQKEESNAAVLEKLTELCGEETEEIRRLSRLLQELKELGWGDRFRLNPSITRGLDYYTGIVYETFLDDLPSIGSVCSGGRYDNLTSIYGKEKLPGVGSSIGLDRLMAALTELNALPQCKTNTQVLLCLQDEALTSQTLALTQRLRQNAIACELYPEAKKLPKQFSYAETKGIPFAIICGQEEIESQTLTLKNLTTRENFQKISFEEAVEKINRMKNEL